MQGSASSQSAAVGQASGPDTIAGSHCSPGSKTPLPQAGTQSLSVFAFAPIGQHVSPSAGTTIGVWEQRAEHVAAEMSWSTVQGSLSSQEAAFGQSPGPAVMAISQVSPGSTTGSTFGVPHVAEQSGSVAWPAFAGQQPSPGLTVVISI